MFGEIEELFFDKESLKKFFLYFCNTNSESPDPITDALTVMINSYIEFTVSVRGVYLFKDFMPVPFSVMNSQQKQYIYCMSSSFRASEHTFSSFCRVENALTYSIENECIVIASPKKKIDAKVIITILLELIVQSKQPSILLFNILIQRLMSKITVDKDILMFAQSEIKKKFISTKEVVQEPEQK